MTLDPRYDPAEIGPNDEGTKLRIVWRDGAVSELIPWELRYLCPCAGCVNEMTGERTIRPEEVDDEVHPTAIHYVGRYALQLVWSDGHSTGIYTFPYLREIGDASDRVG